MKIFYNLMILACLGFVIWRSVESDIANATYWAVFACYFKLCVMQEEAKER